MAYSTATQYWSLPPEKLFTFNLIYDHATRSVVVIQAVLTETGKKHINFNERLGEDMVNLSSVLGNHRGDFKWGSSCFEKSSCNVSLDEGGRKLKADLQTCHGDCVTTSSVDLDDHIDFIEYLTAETDATRKWYRLGFKQLPAPQRTLVLCFDGTSNHFSEQNTNVVKFVDLLRKNDPERQLVYYQTGVGTYIPPGMMSPTTLYVAKKADEGVAWFLYQHVIDGYRYLVETFRDGDRICIFGFSRGAFTARAVAGMVHCVGLLPKHNIEHIPFAYEVYKNADDSHKPTGSQTTSKKTKQRSGYDGALSDASGCSSAKKIRPGDFKKTFCIPARIHLVGVWDSVASVGWLLPKTLPWIDYNPSIVHFRQALALDERRASFVPRVWDHSRTDPKSQTAREVWFKGQHADIGGGAPKPEQRDPDTNQSRLSNISLQWMIRQCLDSAVESGIMFDIEALERYRNAGVLERFLHWGDNESWVDYERRRRELSAALDSRDIDHEPYESLGWSIGWNLLEFLPTSRPVQTPKGFSSTRIPNLYKPRSVYLFDSSHPIAIHASVIRSMGSKEGNGEKYIPRAILRNCDTQSAPVVEDDPYLDWDPDAFKQSHSPGVWSKRMKRLFRS